MKLHGGDVNVVPKVESSVGNTILISVPFEVTDNNEVLDLQSTTQDVSRAGKLESDCDVSRLTADVSSEISALCSHERTAAGPVSETRKLAEILKEGNHTLVVDDTPSNRKMLQRVLQTNGIASDYASDGLEAIDKFETALDKYLLIFIDFTMPRMVLSSYYFLAFVSCYVMLCNVFCYFRMVLKRQKN